MYIFNSLNFNHYPPNTNTHCQSCHFLQKQACLTKLIYSIEWCIIYTLLKEKTAFYLYFGFLSSPESNFSWKQSALVFCSLFWRSDRFREQGAQTKPCSGQSQLQHVGIRMTLLYVLDRGLSTQCAHVSAVGLLHLQFYADLRADSVPIVRFLSVRN